MKVTTPYELLIRFALDGSVSGAHVKTQTCYLDGDTPDLATWREDQATTADLASPLVREWCDAWNIAVTRENEALRTTAASQSAELETLRADLEAVRAELAAAREPPAEAVL